MGRISAAALLLWFLSCVVGNATEPLRIGIQDNRKTFEFVAENGEPAGVLVDLWRAVGEQLGWPLQFVAVTGESAFEMLQRGEIDLIANAPPQIAVAYSQAYLTFDYSLFSLKNRYLETPASLPPRVGLLEQDLPFLGTAPLLNLRHQSFNSHAEMLAALEAGHIDYLVANESQLNFSISGTRLLGLHYPRQIFFSQPVRAAVLPERQELLADLSVALAAMDKELPARVIARWMPGGMGYKLSWPLIGFAFFLSLSTALTITVWIMNLRLKQQVRLATRELVQEKTLLLQAESAAVRGQQFIRSLIDSLDSCVIAVDHAGRVSHLNRAAQVLWRSSCPPHGADVTDGFPFLASYKEVMAEAHALQQPRYFIKQELGQGGRWLADISLLPVELSQQNVLLILVDDVTEAAQKDEALVQMQKLEVIDSLAGGVAHDFNNILAAIDGTANLMKLKLAAGKPLSSEQLGRYLEMILSATARGAATTKSLSALTRRVNVAFADFPLHAAIENVLNICRATLDPSVRIDYHPAEQGYLVSGNQHLLEQALLNLCINAWHAMTIMRPPEQPAGGKLSIVAGLCSADELQQVATGLETAAGTYLRLCVSDTGVGITAEQRERIFTPFFTTKGKGVGTGLGLSMVQNTLRQHQGFIRVDSKEGEGTQVCVYLPCAAVIPSSRSVDVARSPEKMPDPDSAAQGHILLADDNPQIIDSLSAYLEGYGYRVLIARDGNELVAMYRASQIPIDVVVTDLEMPQLTGDQAAKAILKHHPAAKIIMTSGFIEDDRVQKALSAGVADFLAKPFNISDLVAKIERLKTGQG